MSSNIPLLIELHEQTFVNKKEKVWSGMLMVDICHIESIEQVKPASIFMSSEDEEKWRKKMRGREIRRTCCLPAEYYIPAVTIVKVDGREIKVIETYEEIREKIAKAGVVVP